MYEIEQYKTVSGREPFEEWFEDLKDKKLSAKISKLLTRVVGGNLGDYKSIKGMRGLYELREHYGPGYRIYFSIINGKVILLLAGSTKRNQRRAIELAKKYLSDYKERNK